MATHARLDQGRLYIGYPTGQRPTKLKEPGHHDGETTGHALLCVDLATGEHLWERPISGEVEFIYDFERPMSAQPCLARGSAYLGTLDGCLVCLRTGREDADGWYMWGGNARHNKTA